MKPAFRASSMCRKTLTAEIQSGTSNLSTSDPSPLPYSLSEPRPAYRTQCFCPMEQSNMAKGAALPPPSIAGASPFPEGLDSCIAPGVGCRDEAAPRRCFDLPVEDRDQRAPLHLPRDHRRVSDSRPHALHGGVDQHAVEAEARRPREVRRRFALALGAVAIAEAAVAAVVALLDLTAESGGAAAFDRRQGAAGGGGQGGGRHRPPRGWGGSPGGLGRLRQGGAGRVDGSWSRP